MKLKEQLPIEIIRINDDYTADIKIGNKIHYGCYLNNIEENISDDTNQKVIVSFDYPLITKQD